MLDVTLYIAKTFLRYSARNILLLIFVLVLSLRSLTALGQAVTLRGPILVTQLGGDVHSGGQVTFQDIGTGRIWQYPTSAFLYKRNVWLPDGCKILLSDKTHVFSLSITSFKTEDFPSNLVPIWSFDGQSIVFVAFSSDYTYVELYATNSKWQATESIATIPKSDWMNDFYWLSNTQFFYTLSGERKFVWDRATKKISLFGEKQHKSPNYGDFYASRTAPNQEIVAIFADLNEYRSEGNTFVNNLTGNELATLEAKKPTMTGFDLFSLTNGTTRHVDVQGQFLGFLEWSPTSDRVAVVTDYKGNDFAVYVYDLGKDRLHRIATASVYRASIPTIPTWSHDGEWLAFRALGGIFVQRPSDGKRIQLDERMNGDSTRFYWSPVMDYYESKCN